MKIAYPLKPLSIWQVRLLFPPLFHMLADSVGILLAPTLYSNWFEPSVTLSKYLPEFILGTIGMYAITEGNYWSYYYLDKKLSWEHNCGKRLVVQLLLSLCFSIVAAFVIRLFVIWFHPGRGDLFTESFVVLTAITTFVLGVIFLGIFVFYRMNASIIEAEQLKRENLVAQNQALRQQIDPHFLFNSITTLTTLIQEDKNLAIEFVQRLSKVYRHVLQSKEYDLIDLRKELEFVRDYAFALEMRFSGQFKMNINIPDTFLTSKIPPLTLQILVENAVKHNIISNENPLNIIIEIEKESKLVVRNNLKRKTVPNSPTHIGLNNILTRYKYISQGIVEVIENEKEFIVKLPLIKS